MNLAGTPAGWSDSCCMWPGRGWWWGWWEVPLVEAEERPEAQTRASTPVAERAAAGTDVISETEGLN